MRRTAVTLSEVVDLADKEKRKGVDGTVYLHQKETAPGDMPIGDEDAGGGKVEEKIRLLLATGDDSIYYEDEFEDMDFYKDALVQLERLETYYPFERVTEEEIKNKQQEN